jgi:hypothetical protein
MAAANAVNYPSMAQVATAAFASGARVGRTVGTAPPRFPIGHGA